MSKNKPVSTVHFVTVNHKRYPYTLTPLDDQITYVKCQDASIAQEFLNEDVAGLLIDLPHLILAEKKYKTDMEIIRFRISANDRKRIEQKALQKGFSTLSSFLRSLALKA